MRTWARKLAHAPLPSAAYNPADRVAPFDRARIFIYDPGRPEDSAVRACLTTCRLERLIETQRAFEQLRETDAPSDLRVDLLGAFSSVEALSKPLLLRSERRL